MSAIARPHEEFVREWKRVLGEPVRAGNKVESLVDGPETYRSMYDAIQTTLGDDGQAYYIYFLAWWLDEDFPLEPGDRESTFLNLVRQAATNEVQVRIMFWDNTLKALERIDPRVGPWNERVRVLTHQHRKLNALGPNAAAIRDGNNLDWQSHHQKLLVVRGAKGLIGFCGGVDVSRDRIEPRRLHPGSPYHDVHCRIEGPAVHDLVDVFVQRWQAHPEHAAIDRAKGALRGLRDRLAPEKAEPRGDCHVAIRRTFVHPDPRNRKGGCAAELSIASTMLAAIRAARQFIYIEDQYLVGFEIAVALGEAMRHLQHITILIPHSEITDLPDIWEGRLEFLKRIAARNPRDYNEKLLVFFKYEPARGRELPPGSPITGGDFGPGSYIHSKTWVFDDELAVIGSANCNRRGWSYDSEAIAMIFDRQPSLLRGAQSFARALRMRLWAKHLHLPEQAVQNPLDARKLWLAPAARNHVRVYDSTSGRDRSDFDIRNFGKNLFGPIRRQPPRSFRSPSSMSPLTGSFDDEDRPGRDLSGWDERLGPTAPEHPWNRILDPTPNRFPNCRR